MAAGGSGGRGDGRFSLCRVSGRRPVQYGARQIAALPVNVEVYDSVVDPDNLLFRSEAPPNETLGDALMVTRQAAVGGRTWQVIFRPTSTFTPPTSQSVVYLIAVVGLLLAAAIAYVVRLQARAHAIETTLRVSVEKSLKERDLMLQEMKHRIKNSIAKMLAIARQTAANSNSLQDFTSSFVARMQAMAASQDMLTRSQWQKADLGKLLRTELEQVFVPNSERCICRDRRSSSTRPSRRGWG